MALETGTFINDLVISNPVGAVDQKSFGDDHLRLIKTLLKNTFPLAIGARKFQDLTDSAADTLTWLLYRKSATPTANDLLASYAVSGDNSAGAEKVYGRFQVRIDDATAGSEDGSVLIKAMVAGVEQIIATFNSAGLSVSNLSTPGLVDQATARRVLITDTELVVGSTTVNTDYTIRLANSGGSALTISADTVGGASIVLNANGGGNSRLFQVFTSALERFRIDSVGAHTVFGTLTVTG